MRCDPVPYLADPRGIGGVAEAVAARCSTRAFARSGIETAEAIEVLRLAARAPSGGNMQPWQAYLLGRPAIERVATAIRATGVAPHKAEWDDYRYYPERFFGAYDQRRKALGRALYALLGIERREVRRMRAQFDRNFDFFGAPIGVLLTIDRGLEKGSWIDLGMFVQNVTLLAQERGWGSCVQAAFAPYHRAIRPLVGIGPDEVLVCGIAIGHPDRHDPVNDLRTERAPNAEWLRLVG
ncbi:nitroreductase [Jannaschia sp. Os4]|uniref:nitroreductase n=1 Tax=Jannaschia sp. Os4 TaxID=2807617 RepID=UPI00193A72A8|nr:nitroreductase [Jannaschia sp. Os4]MBM2576348.1 nitroreductase [Jannaschia sp. Os4]